MTKPNLAFRRATLADLPEVLALVNSAYRGDESRRGWTTEADLLDGLRIDDADLAKILAGADPERERIELAHDAGGALLGSVLYRREDARTAYLGMIAVRPRRQGGGVGSRLIGHFEALARDSGAARVRMTVISLRTELIAYYERRGYVRTGASEPFPVSADEGYTRLKRGPLVLVELVKELDRIG